MSTENNKKVDEITLPEKTDLRFIPAYFYDELTSTWDEKKDWSNTSVTYNSEELKCAAFNVLFDIYQNNIVYSDIRYSVQIRMLEKLQLDVLTLCEMTPQYLAKLMSEKWVRDHYYLSEIEVGEKKDSGHSTVFPYGNLIMLSKHKFTNVRFLKYKFAYPSNFSRRVILSIADYKTSEEECVRICFGSVHLKAKKECFEVRKKQVAELYELAKQLTKNTCNELIYLGDFNLNMPFETNFITHIKEFSDLWIDIHTANGDKGYTMDGKTNPMLGKMSAADADKQLRLDRVVQWKTSESKLSCTAIRLFATNSIKKLLKNKLLFSEEESQRLSFITKDYLFCSDHYGIYFTMKPKCSLDQQQQLSSSDSK
ncbi:predicted protein [Naegleria gruberi]|uniref:Predicted protein n=1 Tax=Naegleria gruberi TaxID=5762 RepID=D2VH11_NAEGR|nr:uncharacterized protein NAEGRDRAFT_68238 [Naegleria gruberi]EFC43902.1 predicted protein [Naegleria gruberi]|eukprot:XP_002676646.1 predicted protein [Naegleria gruberi strain NEG-M]